MPLFTCLLGLMLLCWAICPHGDMSSEKERGIASGATTGRYGGVHLADQDSNMRCSQWR